MKKLVIMTCVMTAAIVINARNMDELYGVWQHTQQSRADPNSNWNKRMNFLQNWGMQNAQMGGMGGGSQQQDQMSVLMMQLGLQLREQIQWFSNFGEAALQNNRMEYAARLVRLQQLQQAVCNVPGCGEVAATLQTAINFLQWLFNQTAPQNQPIGRATPRFA